MSFLAIIFKYFLAIFIFAWLLGLSYVATIPFRIAFAKNDSKETKRSFLSRLMFLGLGFIALFFMYGMWSYQLYKFFKIELPYPWIADIVYSIIGSDGKHI